MNAPDKPEPRVLLVSAEERSAPLRARLGRRYQVSAAADAERAADLVRAQGPFPVVVAHELAPLRQLRAEQHGSVGVLLAGALDADELLRAVQQGHMFRCVPETASDEELLRAVEESLQRHAQLESERLGADELEFVCDSLYSMNEALGERLAEQAHLLECLHRFAVELSAAESLPAIAGVTARAVSCLVHGRGVHVQLWGDRDVAVAAFEGPEMSAHLHQERLGTRDGALGEITIDLGPDEDARLGERELEALRSIANSCAVAVRNELRRGQRDHAQQAMIQALARLSERRDEATGRHLERVAAYCQLLAEGLRDDGHGRDVIDERFVENLVRSSPLHDIGKVGIPDSILLKPGKLSPEEWNVMRTHAEIGAQTIEGVMREFPDQGFLVCGRDIARGHHERWDGTGYPQGLKGDAIPLAARIVALADVYDALTSTRPYKQAWTHAAAVEWIRGQAGKHFDPRLVAGFLKRAEQADAIRTRLRDSEDEPQRGVERAGEMR